MNHVRTSRLKTAELVEYLCLLWSGYWRRQRGGRRAGGRQEAELEMQKHASCSCFAPLLPLSVKVWKKQGESHPRERQREEKRKQRKGGRGERNSEGGSWRRVSCCILKCFPLLLLKHNRESLSMLRKTERYCVLMGFLDEGWADYAWLD